MNPRRAQRQVKHVPLLVVEGKSEEEYFGVLKRFAHKESPFRRAKIRNFEGGCPSRGIQRALDAAKESLHDAESIMVFLDSDRIAADPNYRAKEARAEKAGVRLIRNAPKFEVWLLWHYTELTEIGSEADFLGRLRRLGIIDNDKRKPDASTIRSILTEPEGEDRIRGACQRAGAARQNGSSCQSDIDLLLDALGFWG
jgi:hypothetical protein